jgi:hypothetical protein
VPVLCAKTVDSRDAKARKWHAKLEAATMIACQGCPVVNACGGLHEKFGHVIDNTHFSQQRTLRSTWYGCRGQKSGTIAVHLRDS